MSVLLRPSEFNAISRELTTGIRVDRATAALPQTAAETIFTVATGRVLIVGLVGEVTTVIQTQANATKLVSNPTATGASRDLCATLDITGDAVGELYSITGTVANAMVSDLLIGNPYLASPLLVSEGAIELNCAASNTGSVSWSLIYVPWDASATVVAA